MSRGNLWRPRVRGTSIYSLTAKGVDLAPILFELSRWGTRYEDGVAPPGVLERWDADRAGLLAELRKSAGVGNAPPAREARRSPPRSKKPADAGGDADPSGLGAARRRR